MITENLLIGDVLAEHPETFEVFLSHGLHCVGCGGALFETIAEGAWAHGINTPELIKDLNAAITK